MIQFLKTIFLLYLVSVGFMYYISARTKGRMVVPGDIYIRKAGREIYFPLASSVILTFILYAVLKRFI